MLESLKQRWTGVWGGGKVWGLAEGRDELLSEFIHFRRADKGACQNVAGCS